jgi:hypothetical protein
MGAGLALVLAACGGGSSPSARVPATSTSTSRPAATTTTPRPPQATVVTAPWRLPRPSAREALVADGGALLVLGGFDGAKQTIGQVLRVDTTTGTTTVAGSLSAAVHDTAGALMKGAATVFGGGNASESAAVQRFDGTGTTVVGRMPIPRSDLAVVTVGARAYVVGGYDGSSIRATTLSTDDGMRFALLGDLPVPVRYPAVAATGTDVVVLGGVSAGGDTRVVQVLDTTTGRVHVAAQLPATLSHASATTVRGQVDVFGGNWGGTPSARVWRWDAPTLQLVPVGTLPAPTTDGAAATIGETAYYVGGESPAPVATVSELRVR